MTYAGEHTFIGQFGHFLVILAFVAALLAFVSYFLSTRAERRNDLEAHTAFKKMGRYAFILHGLSVFGIIACMFIMLTGQYFEYDYVWKHSNKTMPMRYIFSCFWEGQEGSFLLWSFWHVILGGILLIRERKWEAPVMAVFSAVQFFLTMMLLGLYFGDFKLGSSPFILVRELPENVGLPWTDMVNYLQAIPLFQDGRGLNPLLQNYWMTIHPPTLFLGFAATLIPFAYAIAGLWKREYTAWVKPAISWTFFGVMTLGAGILMGGAWAYEALSFGGFWAWDPVENASFVPWIVLVAAAHVMLITNNKAGSWFTSALLAMLAYVLIIYSTFLTRSGVLGDASVHSFVGDGMLGTLLVGLLFILWLSLHLLMRSKIHQIIHFGVATILCFLSWGIGDWYGIFLTAYVATAVVLLIVDYIQHWPKLETEESVLSREFWMFLGSVVLILSALQITFETSKPAFAKLFNAKWTITSDLSERAAEFHEFQIPFAIALMLFMGVAQYLKYRKTDPEKLVKHLIAPAVISALIAATATFLLPYNGSEWMYVVMLFTACFAVLCNLDYWLRILKGKVKLSGSPIAHIGFALVLAGALISTSKSEKISSTTYDITSLDENLSRNESVLMIQGDTVPVGPYYAIFQGKFKEGVNMHYEIEYLNTRPRNYSAGDMIYNEAGVFEAAQDHTTGESFEEDLAKNYWRIKADANLNDMDIAQPWSRAPGEHAFILYPMVQMNDRFGNVPEPDTRHWLTSDLYTHMQYALLDDPEELSSEWKEPEDHELAIGDTMLLSEYLVVLDTVLEVEDPTAIGLDSTDFAVTTQFHVYDQQMKKHLAEPLTIYDKAGNLKEHVFTSDTLGLKFQMADFNPFNRKLTVTITEKNKPMTDFVVMQAIVFPFINILWIGCILMVLGTTIAIWQRIKRNRKLKAS